MFAIGRLGIVAEPTQNRTGFDQADMHAAAVQFHAQGIAQPLERKLTGGVGAAVGQGDDTQHRAVLHYAAVALSAHHRDDSVGQVQPAEYVGFELFSQSVARQVLDGPRLAVSAVVEQPIQMPAGLLEHVIHGPPDRFRIVEVQPIAVQALVA